MGIDTAKQPQDVTPRVAVGIGDVGYETEAASVLHPTVGHRRSPTPVALTRRDCRYGAIHLDGLHLGHSLFSRVGRMLRAVGGYRSACADTMEAAMAGKNKGGRESRKPKQDKNKKHKGQTPLPRSSTAIDVINHVNPPPRD